MGLLDRFFRRGDSGADPAVVAVPPKQVEVEVEVFDGTIGWHTIGLQITGSRVSDALNDEIGAQLDDALFVIPPAEPRGDPARRLHRPAHPLWVRAGDWSVVGSLHLPPGSAGSAYLLRRTHQFFILTDAVLARSVLDAREERRVPVLLVNLHQVSSLRDTPEPEVAPSLEPVPPA